MRGGFLLTTKQSEPSGLRTTEAAWPAASLSKAYLPVNTVSPERTPHLHCIFNLLINPFFLFSGTFSFFS